MAISLVSSVFKIRQSAFRYKGPDFLTKACTGRVRKSRFVKSPLPCPVKLKFAEIKRVEHPVIGPHIHHAVVFITGGIDQICISQVVICKVVRI